MGQIMLVEDNQAAVRQLKDYIHKISPDFTVSVFTKASDAYANAKMNKIDLFIVDIQLADYKGTSLAKQLRDLPHYKYTPIIFESALAGEELNAYRDVKCYGFLIKPYTEAEFTKTFCEAMGLSQKLSQDSKKIQIEQKQFIFEYAVHDIAYVEAFGKKLVIHTNMAGMGEKEDMISGYNLHGLLELIDHPSFVQCHKSYAVNREHILRIDIAQKVIYLANCRNGVPIGNKYSSEVLMSE